MFYCDSGKSTKEIKLEKVNDKCTEIFRKISLLADEMKVDSTLSLCNLYSHLLYRGNLSIDRKFEQSINKIVDDGAANIMLGYGCCRNISDGLSTLLTLNNVENYELTTKFNPYQILFKYNPVFNIDYKDQGKTKFIRLLNLFKPYDYRAWHGLNLVIEDNGYFVYDATWRLILELKGLRLKVINGTGYMKIIFSESNFKDILDNRSVETRRYLKQLESLGSYKFDEFKELSKLDFIKFNDSSNLIDSFYCDVHPDIESVCKILKQHTE